MALSDKAKRRTAAASLAVAIAIPAEGLRQWAYYDPPGILTVCYGSTTNVQKGVKYSMDECKARLDDDMRAAIAQVDACAPGLPVPVLAAFGDAVYNLGPKIACDTTHSTAARLLKAGDLAGACQQLPRWAKAQIGGVMLQLPGLVKRREKERQLCLSGLDSVSEADGRGEGLFTPPAFYSEQESVLADSEFTSPRRNTLCAAFKTHHDIAFRVPLLLVNSRPSAVAWEVPLRSINAVQSASIRSLAHVSQEVFEFKPRLTNCNPNGAVARISWVVRPSASTNHVRPSVIGASSVLTSSGVSVFHTGGLPAFVGTVCAESGATRVNGRPITASALPANSAFHLASLAQNRATVAGRSVELPGLTKRRAKEMNLCLEGVA